MSPVHPPEQAGRVLVVGVAPGAAALDPTVLERLGRVAWVAGAPRLLDLLPPATDVEQVPVEGNLNELVARLGREPASAAALLASGDPGFFGVAGLVLRAVEPSRVEILPAVSSMQLAFARAGEPWSQARFASLHGRPLDNLAATLGAPALGLFTDPRNSPAAIARYVEECGWGDLEMVVAEDLGLPSERLRRGPVSEFLKWQGSDLNVVLLLRREPDPRPTGPGLPEELFSHSRGLITKAEVRATALALLEVPRRGVLWDVGAGSGSVSVEACLMQPERTAYAVERSADGIAHITENRKRFRVPGVRPVHGPAPEALTELPAPDAVFVGGSGGALEPILDLAVERLPRGGRLVVSAVLVDTLCRALAWGEARGLVPDLRELRCSRSRPLGGHLQLEPLNPVTLARFTAPVE